MIAPIKRRTTRKSTSAWHAAFLAMVPRIRRQARISFRNARPELREELIHEVVTNCFAGEVEEHPPSSLPGPSPD